MKELEKSLQKVERGVSKKRRKWAKQQKAEVNKLNLRSQLGQTWEKLLLEYFENEMSAASSAQLHGDEPFHPDWVSVLLHVVLSWSCIGRSELKFGNKSPYVCRMMRQYVASCSTLVNSRASGNNSQLIPFTRDSQKHYSFLVNSPGYDERTREVRGQKPACVPDNDALCCFMQHLSPHQSFGH